MSTLLMAANSSVAHAVADSTLVLSELSLAGVDISSRKIPLFHRIEFYLWFSATPASWTLARFGVLSDDSLSNILSDDDDVIAMGMINIDESGGGYRLISPRIIDFATPVAKATSKIWVGAYSSTAATYGFYVQVRVFYEIKIVSSNVMVALLAN